MKNEIKELMRQNGVVIYGAGRLGQQVYQELVKYNFPKLLVWDRNAEVKKNSSVPMNITYPDFSYYDKKIVILICIYPIKVCLEVQQKLQENGFLNIIFSRNLKNGLYKVCENKNYDEQVCNKCIVNKGGCKGYEIYRWGDNIQANLPIETIFTSVTIACSLHCKNCIQHTVEFKEKKIDWKVDVEKFYHGLDKLVEAIGWLKTLQITGGEIFLYKDWKKLVEYCISNKKIGIIHILSTGVCKISQEDIEVLKNKKIVITIDDYGMKISEEKRRYCKDFINMLEINNINYSVLNNDKGTWYDFGNFSERDEDTKKLKEKFSSCSINECYAFNQDYSFSICGRQSIAKKLNYVDTTSMDSIYIGEKTNVEILRRQIKELIKKDYLEICRYCDGNKNIVIAGEQAEHIKDEGTDEVEL